MSMIGIRGDVVLVCLLDFDCCCVEGVSGYFSECLCLNDGPYG